MSGWMKIAVFGKAAGKLSGLPTFKNWFYFIVVCECMYVLTCQLYAVSSFSATPFYSCLMFIWMSYCSLNSLKSTKKILFFLVLSGLGLKTNVYVPHDKSGNLNKLKFSFVGGRQSAKLSVDMQSAEWKKKKWKTNQVNKPYQKSVRCDCAASLSFRFVAHLPNQQSAVYVQCTYIVYIIE